jgi:MFS family permease
MGLAAQATGVLSLSVWRVISGLGIGGMLATINSVAAEFSNSRRRALCVSLMAIGYPVGAVVGGSIAAVLLKSADWRAVFYFGAAVTAAYIPLVFFLVPESIAWLCQRQPANALALLNRSLTRMGRAAVDALPPIAHAGRRRSAADIFSPQFLRITLLMSVAYFLHVTSFYFIVKWVPKIVVDFGFNPASAAGVLVWVNVGGATGGAVLGLLSLRFGLKPLTMAVLALSTVMLAVFGHAHADLTQLAIVCAMAGFCTNAGIVGLYGILAQVFPTHLRATGTGFAVGTGRAGSFLAPIIAGFLFRAGYGLQFVALVMGVGSFAAAIALWFLPFKSEAVASAD